MKKFLFSIMMMVPLICIQAQNTNEAYNVNDSLDQKAAIKTTFLADPAKDHWFISLSGGVADLMSEESNYVGFADRVKPTIGLTFGRWMSPVWGIRMNITGSKLQGFATWVNDAGLGSWYAGKKHPFPGANPTNTYVPAWDPAYTEEIKNRFLNMDDPVSTSKGDGYTYDVTYAAATVDFLLNLNYFFGAKYKEDRFFQMFLYGGLGAAHTFGDKDKNRTHINSFAQRYGLTFDFRLNNAWSINLDGNFLILPEMFDYRVGDGNTQDAVGSYTIGLTYKFKRREFTPAQLRDPNEVAALNNQINNLRAENQKLALRPVSCPECPKCPECPECPEVDVLKTPIVKQDVKFLPTPVFFKINSAVIDKDQWTSIQKAAEYLQENPNAKIKVTGYADRQTGTPAVNKRLSEKRAKAVYDALISKYNIAANRIETNYMGDAVQPFAENDWNRVVVFVIPD